MNMPKMYMCNNTNSMHYNTSKSVSMANYTELLSLKGIRHLWRRWGGGMIY